MSIGQLKINAIRLVGGVGVLDYLNTCDGRRPGSALGEVVDKLSCLQDIVHWFLHAGLIEADEHEHLLGTVEAASWHGLTAFRQLIDFRESLYQLLLPVALGHGVDPLKLDTLNAELARTAGQRILVPTPLGALWHWRPCDSLQAMTDGFISRLAVQAAALLTSPDILRLKVCGTPNCDWLFIDTSKNGRRRWCQMNVCGAREKARRALEQA
ncbi:CGNR zinc finger domain-containing protein [Pseudomonas sp. NPDC090202]|uniref:CGNR zinc finger domain-containing protein n=1 Tax=unclassified Pseudomonas TaxID=196821 RepID=UPI00380E04A5